MLLVACIHTYIHEYTTSSVDILLTTGDLVQADKTTDSTICGINRVHAHIHSDTQTYKVNSYVIPFAGSVCQGDKMTGSPASVVSSILCALTGTRHDMPVCAPV